MRKVSPVLTRKITRIVDHAYYLYVIEQRYVDPLDRYA